MMSKSEYRDKDNVIAEAVELLEWADNLQEQSSWVKGFKRGVEHMAETLVGEGVLDWGKLKREAVKK